MRRVTSILLALSFALLTVTGLSMMLRHGPPSMAGEGRGLGPPDGRGQGPGFRAAGPRGEQRGPLFLVQLHEVSALVMVVAGIVHIALNRRPLLAYIGVRRQPCGPAPS